MGDKCVVCGEADQGKPLYKKLGSGEFNVEVIVALRDLELTSLPESAKNDHYICWDCDETILQEYGRYLEYEEKRKAREEKEKEEKKTKRNEQRKRRKLQRLEIEQKIKTTMKKIPVPTFDSGNCSKTKRLEIERANNVHHSTHCLMCDSTFESANRGYYRYTLKKMVNDDMDVASVMEYLGLARRVAPEMKAKRFICNNCFYTIRRNYKNKLLKGTSIESPSDVEIHTKKNPIHRATPDEHAAEIAKLVPPALAECYKIMTSNSVASISGRDVKEKTVDSIANSNQVESKHDQKIDTEGDEEEGLRVSQDEHGNFVIDMKITSPPKANNSDQIGADGKEATDKPTDPQLTPRKKKNVLLPKRHHHHLLEDNGANLNHLGLTSPNNTKTGPDGSKDENTKPGESVNSRTCNICGRNYAEKPDDWWHSLGSSLSGFESITISMALQLLETSLANTSEKAREASQVCFPCYGMVSSGFRIQVVQRIARQKNIEASKVNFSKVKVRMVRKEDLLGMDGKKPELKDEQRNVTSALGNENTLEEVNTTTDQKGLKRKNPTEEEAGVKKQKVNNIGTKNTKIKNNAVLESAYQHNHARYPVSNRNNILDSESSSEDSDDYASEDSDLSDGSELDAAAHIASSDPSYEMSSDSDREINQSRKKVLNQKIQSRVVSPKTPLNSAIGRGTGISHGQPSIPGISPGKPRGTGVIPGKSFDDKKDNFGVTSMNRGKAATADRNQKEVPGICSVKEVLVVNSGTKVGDVSDVSESGRKEISYESESVAPHKVNADCQFYFALSKMRESTVMLQDIQKSLPKEAFDGRTLSVRALPGAGYHISLANKTLPSSALQFMLNTMVPPNWPSNVKKVNIREDTEDDDKELCNGRCVVCAELFDRARKFWHNLSEDISPPSLQVPVRWVLASLSIAPVKLTSREREEGKVCEICFDRLTKQFDDFVRVKIGESCEMAPKEVNIGEYVVTFNQETMNIEADPVDLTPEEEMEESERILQKIMPVVKSFSMDSLVEDESYMDPLRRDEYTVWMLLALNELRVQMGASIEHLVSWLTRLMPMELHWEELRPCGSKVMVFINRVAVAWDVTKKDSFEKLNRPLPTDLFISKKKPLTASESTKKSSEVVEIKKEIKQEEGNSKMLEPEYEMKWEDFLDPVNMDLLLAGNGKPVHRKDFNNGLLYALWRFANIIGADNEKLAGWLRQVAPIPLEDDHVKLLINAPKPIHDHLEQHPEDLVKLDCVIIPEATYAAQVAANAVNNKIPQATNRSKSKTPSKQAGGNVVKSPGLQGPKTNNVDLVKKSTKASKVAIKSAEIGKDKGQTTPLNKDSQRVSRRKEDISSPPPKRQKMNYAQLLREQEGKERIIDGMYEPSSDPLSLESLNNTIPEDDIGNKESKELMNNVQVPTRRKQNKHIPPGPKCMKGIAQKAAADVISNRKVLSAKDKLPKNSSLVSNRDDIPLPNVASGNRRGKAPLPQKLRNHVVTAHDKASSQKSQENQAGMQGRSSGDNSQSVKFKDMLKDKQEGISSSVCVEENSEEQNNDDQREAMLLASKVKELERQLQAVKRQNEELLQMNQKLAENVSTDESEEVTEKRVAKKIKTPDKNRTVNSLVESKVQNKSVPDKSPVKGKVQKKSLPGKSSPVKGKVQNKPVLGKSLSKLPPDVSTKGKVLKKKSREQRSSVKGSLSKLTKEKVPQSVSLGNDDKGDKKKSNLTSCNEIKGLKSVDIAQKPSVQSRSTKPAMSSDSSLIVSVNNKIYKKANSVSITKLNTSVSPKDSHRSSEKVGTKEKLEMEEKVGVKGKSKKKVDFKGKFVVKEKSKGEKKVEGKDKFGVEEKGKSKEKVESKGKLLVKGKSEAEKKVEENMKKKKIVAEEEIANESGSAEERSNIKEKVNEMGLVRVGETGLGKTEDVNDGTDETQRAFLESIESKKESAPKTYTDFEKNFSQREIDKFTPNKNTHNVKDSGSTSIDSEKDNKAPNTDVKTDSSIPNTNTDVNKNSSTPNTNKDGTKDNPTLNKSIFYERPTPKTNIDGEKDSPTPNTIIEGEKNTPTTNTNLDGENDSPIPNTIIEGEKNTPTPNIDGEKDGPIPNTSIDGEKDCPTPNTNLDGEKDSPIPNNTDGEKESLLPNTNIDCEKDSPTPNMNTHGEKESLIPNTNIDGEKDSPTPNKNTDGEKERLIPNTNIDGEKDRPIPNTDGEKDCPTQNMNTHGEKDSPIPNTNIDGEKDNPIPNTNTDGEKDHPIPNTNTVGEKDSPIPNTNTDGEKDSPVPNTNADGEKDGPIPNTNIDGEKDGPTPITSKDCRKISSTPNEDVEKGISPPKLSTDGEKGSLISNKKRDAERDSLLSNVSSDGEKDCLTTNSETIVEKDCLTANLKAKTQFDRSTPDSTKIEGDGRTEMDSASTNVELEAKKNSLSVDRETDVKTSSKLEIAGEKDSTTDVKSKVKDSGSSQVRDVEVKKCSALSNRKITIKRKSSTPNVKVKETDSFTPSKTSKDIIDKGDDSTPNTGVVSQTDGAASQNNSKADNTPEKSNTLKTKTKPLFEDLMAYDI